MFLSHSYLYYFYFNMKMSKMPFGCNREDVFFIDFPSNNFKTGKDISFVHRKNEEFNYYYYWYYCCCCCCYYSANFQKDFPWSKELSYSTEGTMFKH